MKPIVVQTVLKAKRTLEDELKVRKAKNKKYKKLAMYEIAEAPRGNIWARTRERKPLHMFLKQFKRISACQLVSNNF